MAFKEKFYDLEFARKGMISVVSYVAFSLLDTGGEIVVSHRHDGWWSDTAVQRIAVVSKKGISLFSQ